MTIEAKSSAAKGASCKPFVRSLRLQQSEPASASTSKSSTRTNPESGHARVGLILGHFGVRGDIKVDPLDSDALSAGKEITLGASASSRRFRIQKSRGHNKFLVIHLAGVDTMEAARALRGQPMFVRRSALPKLPPKMFRAIDLVGFEVKDKVLGSLGKVKGVRHYPACDMLVVGDKDLLVPMLDAYCFAVNRRKKEVAVVLPPGFEEL